MLRLSGNARSAQSYEDYAKELHLFRRRYFNSPGNIRRSNEQHLELYEAIARGDCVRAKRAAERHVMEGRQRLLSTLDAGDFACYGGCKVQVAVDGAAPPPMAASRPETDEAIAMFIEDERALWRLADAAKVLSIEFPVKAGGTRTAVFEVGGLDRSQLPKWN